MDYPNNFEMALCHGIGATEGIWLGKGRTVKVSLDLGSDPQHKSLSLVTTWEYELRVNSGYLCASCLQCCLSLTSSN